MFGFFSTFCWPALVWHSRFLPALLTAVLTNHLAWVPTVMPNGQPPIKIFLEKHSSKTVDMLAKTHPYNPLWAQLGEVVEHTQSCPHTQINPVIRTNNCLVFILAWTLAWKLEQILTITSWGIDYLFHIQPSVYALFVSLGPMHFCSCFLFHMSWNFRCDV